MKKKIERYFLESPTLELDTAFTVQCIFCPKLLMCKYQNKQHVTRCVCDALGNAITITKHLLVAIDVSVSCFRHGVDNIGLKKDG